MIRYNQGFGKVGPMEQCSDGEWVKYQDAEEVIEELKESITNLRNFNAELISENQVGFDGRSYLRTIILEVALMFVASFFLNLYLLNII